MKRTKTIGPPMTLGNMRELGVQRLIAPCINDACRHTALIDVSISPADTEVRLPGACEVRQRQAGRRAPKMEKSSACASQGSALHLDSDRNRWGNRPAACG